MTTIDDIRAAAAAISERVHRTPMLSTRSLSELVGSRVFLKAECLQRTGSFKVRGVFNRLRFLTPEERSHGVIGISAGNHAQALAYAASIEGIRSTVVMPKHASEAKVEACRGYGAEVVLHGDVFEAFDRMEELRAERGLTLIHPYDDPHVIAGHGTAGLEIIDDVPDVDVVIVPVGGGGLLSGIAAAVKQLRPNARVVGIEPEGAPAMRAALDAGEPVRLDRIRTIADGLSAPIAGVHTLAHVREFVDDIVLVTDGELMTAVAYVLERCKILLEPAGAAAVAALMSDSVWTRMRHQVVCVASGGNFDLQRLKEML